MPLHDWRDDRGFDGIHLLWLGELIRWLNPRLPDEYRAYVGAVPGLSIESPNGRADLTVRRGPGSSGSRPQDATAVVELTDPDAQGAAIFTTDLDRAVTIELHGRIIAVIEIVSPRNKDRPESRTRYLGRYAGYLRRGIQLLLLDVLPRPYDFSFADAIAADIGFPLAPCPAPFAVSFCVGEPVPEGTLTAVWTRPLRVGQQLPTIPLPLTVRLGVSIDLEATYHEATHLAYLD